MNSLSWPGPEPLEVTTLCRSTAARKNARARGSLVKPNCPKLSKAMCLCQVRIAMIAMTSPRTHVLACWLRLWALELGPHIVASGFIPSSRGMGSLLLRVFISGFFLGLEVSCWRATVAFLKTQWVQSFTEKCID